jgi:ABC-type nitrate/sulfonate/bicarbonate transport system substrate-binding protein
MTAGRRVRISAGSGETFGVDDLACAAATQLGLWAAEGLDVEWIPAQGGVAATRATLDGVADIAYAGLGPVVGARAAGEPCRIVVSMARALAQNLVVRRAVATTEGLRGARWAVDGMGALSHHMARLVVAALGIDEGDIDWQVAGPPPRRIEGLLAGRYDASLIRIEEALSLSRSHADMLHTLAGFDALRQLVPTQPHGVLATTEAFEARNPDTLHRLVRGMVLASRRLHDDYGDFAQVVRRWVSVPLDEEDIRMIWQRERDSGGFAVDGELSAGHWAEQLRLYFALNAELAPIEPGALIAGDFLADTLAGLGLHAPRIS